MGFNNLSRKKISITYHNEAVKRYVGNWLYSEGLEHDAFEEILRMAGLTDNAIEVVGIEQSTLTLKSTHQTCTVQLFFGKLISDIAEIRVTTNTLEVSENRRYQVYRTNGNPTVYLSGKVLKKSDSDKILDNCYSKYYYNKNLTSGNLTLTITIYEPNFQEDCSQPRISKRNDEIEEYLMGLDLSKLQNLDGVWDKIKSLLEFSADDISQSEKIVLTLKSTGKNERILGKIGYHKGVLTEYAANNDDGESLLVIATDEQPGYNFIFTQELNNMEIASNGSLLNVSFTCQAVALLRIDMKTYIDHILEWLPKLLEHLDNVK